MGPHSRTMKKYFLMLLAATLTLGFTACGDDEKEEPQPEQEQKPTVIAFEDYSSTIGMSLNAMLQKYGEPSMNFGSYYAYEFKEGNVSSLTIAVNPDNNQVYLIMEMLKENAYKAEDIQAYFASKYHFYAKTVVDADEEEGIPATVTYTYGNTENIEDATLVISVSDNSSVSYSNPKNVPEEQPQDASFDDFTPLDVFNSFMGEDIEDIMDEYEGAIIEIAGMYMGTTSDNEWLTGFALSVGEDGSVTSITLFFDEGLEDSDIIDYFTANGWTCTQNGEADEEGFIPYVFTKDNMTINYQGYLATMVGR